jgi:hypothetical protein
MFKIPETSERFSFEPFGSTSCLKTWVFHAWNVLRKNEDGKIVHHTGFRLFGFRYDAFEVRHVIREV